MRTDPDLMRAVPDAVAAGGEIEAVFPRGSTRGPGFVLERATDEGWAWWFAISGDTDAPDIVNTFTAEEFVARNVVWDSGPAFDSTDPHLIPVPEDAEPGLWRVCTVPDTPGLCAEFEVTTSASSPPIACAPGQGLQRQYTQPVSTPPTSRKPWMWTTMADRLAPQVP